MHFRIFTLWNIYQCSFWDWFDRWTGWESILVNTRDLHFLIEKLTFATFLILLQEDVQQLLFGSLNNSKLIFDRIRVLHSHANHELFKVLVHKKDGGEKRVLVCRSHKDKRVGECFVCLFQSDLAGELLFENRMFCTNETWPCLVSTNAMIVTIMKLKSMLLSEIDKH